MSCWKPFNYGLDDVKEKLSKFCWVSIQGNDWSDHVSNYDNDFDEVDYEIECL